MQSNPNELYACLNFLKVLVHLISSAVGSQIKKKYKPSILVLATETSMQTTASLS